MELSREYVNGIKSTQKKGKYDASQLDSYLNSIIDGIERQKNEVEALRAELKKYKEMEASLASALISAQRTADTLIKDAEKKAADLIADAKINVEDSKRSIRREEESIRERYKKEHADLISQIYDLKAFRDEYAAALQNDLDGFSEKLATLTTDHVWEDRPVSVEEQPKETEPDASFDINEILKNLPESDSDLKAMIDKLI